MLSRRSCALALAATLATTLVGTAPGGAVAKPDKPYPKVMDLPDGWQPEGIAIGPNKRAWLGSLRRRRASTSSNLKTGEGEVVSQGPGTPSVGLKVDRRGRLFVAGGNAGNARVVDTETGDILDVLPAGRRQPASSTTSSCTARPRGSPTR